MTPMGVGWLRVSSVKNLKLFWLYSLSYARWNFRFGCQLANERRGCRLVSISSTGDALGSFVCVFYFSYSQLVLLLLVSLVGQPINIPHKKCAIIKTCCASMWIWVIIVWIVDWQVQPESENKRRSGAAGLQIIFIPFEAHGQKRVYLDSATACNRVKKAWRTPQKLETPNLA